MSVEEAARVLGDSAFVVVGRRRVGWAVPEMPLMDGASLAILDGEGTTLLVIPDGDGVVFVVAPGAEAASNEGAGRLVYRPVSGEPVDVTAMRWRTIDPLRVGAEFRAWAETVSHDADPGAHHALRVGYDLFQSQYGAIPLGYFVRLWGRALGDP